MKVNKATIRYRIPGLGDEFTTGQNCQSIELVPEGFIIGGVLNEVNRLPYAWTIIVSQHGWARLKPEEVVTGPTCEYCGEVFTWGAALASHIRAKHRGSGKGKAA